MVGCLIISYYIYDTYSRFKVNSGNIIQYILFNAIYIKLAFDRNLMVRGYGLYNPSELQKMMGY